MPRKGAATRPRVRGRRRYSRALCSVTPPVGTVLNVVAGVGRMRMDDVTRGVMPFMAVQFAVMFLMVLFPQIVMVPARWFY